MKEEEPLELEIDWDAPAETSPGQQETTVAIISRARQADLGFSPQFPNGIVLYFRSNEPHALVFEGDAAAAFLLQARAILVHLGIVQAVDAEELEEGFRKPLKTNLLN